VVLKGHSLVFETGGAIPAEALFLEYREASGEILTPELFPRADGTTSVCAISTMGPLPVDPADVAADDGAHARLEALCRNISPVLAAAPIKAWQACFRPVTEDGLPLIGAVPGVDGGFVATGHSVAVSRTREAFLAQREAVSLATPKPRRSFHSPSSGGC
jgi:glycine/D-amino acid oxidase-like deaminating enzyme